MTTPTTTSDPRRAQLTLPSDTEILIVRDFAAPPARVFDAWTTPAWVARWFGCDGMEVASCELDLRPGGVWRRVTRFGGAEHAHSGEYHQVERPHVLVYTERYEPVPGSEHLVTVGFDARGAGTRLTMHLRYPDRATRDGHLQVGMERGLQDAWARLDAITGAAEARSA